MPKQYQLHLKGFVGGFDFDADYVDYILGKHKDSEVDVLIDSFIEGAPAKATPLWYLGESIKLLGSADVVVFAPGWENACDCRIERRCAEEYGIPMLNLGNITIEE